MRMTPTALLLTALIGLCAIPAVSAHEVADGKKARDIDTVNSDIDVGNNAETGDLDSVNGDIEVGAGSKIGDTDTVNGDIELADGVHAGGADTVNGEIKGGRDVLMMRPDGTDLRRLTDDWETDIEATWARGK